MTTESSDTQASAFSSRPMLVGKIMVYMGLLVVFWTSFFVPDKDVKEIARVAGAALILVGGLSYGFGRLIRATYKSPRSGAA